MWESDEICEGVEGVEKKCYIHPFWMDILHFWIASLH